MRATVVWLLLAAAMVCRASPARSEEPSIINLAALPSMTLPEALAYAAAHQPQLRSALAEFAARQSEARVPRSLWLPRVGATAQVFLGTANNTTASYINVPETALPRIGATRAGTTNFTPYPSTLAAVTLTQEVFDSGRIMALTAVADALADVARARVDSTRLDIGLEVEETFSAVLAAKEVEQATEEAYRRAVTHRDFARAGTTSGMRPPIELTRAEADVAQLDVRRLQAVSGLETARAALAAAIGSDALEVDARSIKDGNNGTSSVPTLDDAMKRAAARNPIVVAALARIRAQAANTRAIGRELLPNVFGSATLSTRGGGAAPSSGPSQTGDGWLPGVPNWDVGVVLQWSLFDATVLARRAAAAAREEVARANLETARAAVSLAVERAFVALVSAERTLPGLGVSVAAARANQAQADARFRAGLGTTVELADAEALLTSAQLELAIGRFAVARAAARLEAAVGEAPPLPTVSPGTNR